MSNVELHVAAADGYKKTDATVALDGTEDLLIVREAGRIFGDLGVRAQIDREVANVREEVRAGRLHWTRADVQRLIMPYPTHAVDKILAEQGEHAGGLEEDETPWDDTEEKEAARFS